MVLLVLLAACDQPRKYVNEDDSETLGEKSAVLDLSNDTFRFYTEEYPTDQELPKHPYLIEVDKYIKANGITVVRYGNGTGEGSGMDVDLYHFIDGYNRIFYRKHLELKKLLDVANAEAQNHDLFPETSR